MSSRMADDEDDFAYYGTPLEPIEEDAVPSKRPTPIEEQVVRDKQGKRRFHGAFTGGFSAGYCNTVGSEEGWTPSTFKSSRSEKASQQFQKPEDFMDEEDKGVFGIAPKVLRATTDYKQSAGRKRPHMDFSSGPIPGQPVLRDILQPVKDTVGVRLLRSMGWRPGQGVGPRLNHKQKKIQQREIKKAASKVYGCQMLPASSSARSVGSGDESSDESDLDLKSVTFAPDDYAAFIVKTKDDVFGIGYKGLDKRPILSGHVQLFEPSFLGMQEKKKKVAIWGQAFGVGALEEDDEDIYAKDDMSRYDFALDTSAMIAQRKREERASEHQRASSNSALRELGAPLEGFILGKKQPSSQRKYFKPPDLPPGYKAVHETKQSRWDVTTISENVVKKQGLGRHDLDARGRASILDEPLPPPTISAPLQIQATPLVPPTSVSETFSFASGSSFRPFSSQPDKQARYEKFLEISKSGQKDLLFSIQPPSMTEWDKEHERSEFEQAARLYRPLSGIMSDKFVSASQSDDALNPLIPVERMKHGNDEMRNAAKMKMFGKLTRTQDHWQPCALLCKRFNVPQPSCSLEVLKSSQRTSQSSVFQFLEASAFNTVQQPAEVVKQESGPPVVTSKQPELIEQQEASLEKQPEANYSEGQPAGEKRPHSISDTLARLLADNTGKVQPEPEEKPDLFRAIFLSSSDSESDSEDSDKEAQEKHAALKNDTPVLRNLSPPRGIFANLDLDALNVRPTAREDGSQEKSQTKSQAEENSPSNDKQLQDELMYGPRLPTAVPKMNVVGSYGVVPTGQTETKTVSAVWVERPTHSGKISSSLSGKNVSSDSDDSSDSSSKKKKMLKKKKEKKHSKHKKEKKHKKHKSKHKKKH